MMAWSHLRDLDVHAFLYNLLLFYYDWFVFSDELIIFNDKKEINIVLK